MRAQGAYMRMYLALFAAGILGMVVLYLFFSPASVVALSIDHADYDIGQTISVSCAQPTNNYHLFDMTPGIDGEPDLGGNIGEYSCADDATLSFVGEEYHSYAILELLPGGSCGDTSYSGCATQEYAWARVDFMIIPGGGFSDIVSSTVFGLDKSVYTPDEQVSASCSFTYDVMAFYDITDGTDNPDGFMGEFECAFDAVEGLTLSDGHQYKVAEMVPGGSCDGMSYDECTSQEVLKNIASFSVSVDGGGDDGGGGGSDPVPATPGVSKDVYVAGETVAVTCSLSTGMYQLFDVTPGIDGQVENGGNIGLYSCTNNSYLSFASLPLHSYAIVELAPASSCAGESYNTCISEVFMRAIYNFDVVGRSQEATKVTRLAIPAKVTAPKNDDVLTGTATISYTADATNISLYYSDQIDTWDPASYIVIDPSLKTKIAEKLPGRGSLAWDVRAAGLIPGVPYRIILNGIAGGGSFVETVSGMFTVDLSSPEFTVSIDPTVTHGEDVRITVDATEALRSPPVVMVQQEGMATSTAVVTEGEGTHFEGVYRVVSGYDGIAHVLSVSGADRVGNAATTTLTDMTFAVGVEPPPAPKIVSPRNGDTFATSTFSVVGTTRKNTTVTLTVNNRDTYRATPSLDGSFVISDVTIAADRPFGLNALSMVAYDQLGVVSQPTSISLKYNTGPTVVLTGPEVDARLGGVAVITARGADVNNDALTYTYQIIPADEYDRVRGDAATSSVQKGGGWQTLASKSAAPRYSWTTTDVDNGPYYVRVTVDDGKVKATTAARRVFVDNTLPFFRFEDGRRTVTRSADVSISGRALEPKGLVPAGKITKIEYSVDRGRSWTSVEFSSLSDGNARFYVPFTIDESTGEDVYSTVWRVTDSRGLMSETSHPIVFDRTAPEPPVLEYPRAGSIVEDGADANEQRAGLQLAFKGRAEPQSTVTLTYASTTRTAKAGADGTFAFTGLDIESRGAHTVRLTATDTVGNVSSSTRQSFWYDNLPTVTFTAPKAGRGIRGETPISWNMSDSDGDELTASSLRYRRGTGAWTTLASDLGSSTSFVWDARGLVEAAGYELRLDVSDGIATTSRSIVFSVDETAPSLATFTLKKDMLGPSAALMGDGRARDTLSGIEYVEYAISTVGVQARDWVTAIITKGYLTRDALFSLTHPLTLADGRYTVSARAVDAAGNTSSVSTRDLTVDATPPRIGTFAVAVEGARITPDQKGIVELYPHTTAQFGVSLEQDTAQATLMVGSSTVPLTYQVRSGLWEGEIVLDEFPVAVTLALSATDALGNAVHSAPIGSIMPAAYGRVVAVGDDGTRTPLPQAHIRVATQNESTGAFIPVNYVTAAGVPTNAEGYYQLLLTPGTYQLTVEAVGYEGQPRTITRDRTGVVSEILEVQVRKSIPVRVQSFFERIINVIMSYL